MRVSAIVSRAEAVKNDREERQLFYEVLLAIARGVCLDAQGAAMAALHTRATKGGESMTKRSPEAVHSFRVPKDLLNAFSKYSREKLKLPASQLLRALMEAAIHEDPSRAPCFNLENSAAEDRH